MPAVTPFAIGFDAYHLGIARTQNPYPDDLGAARDFTDGWDTAEERELDKAEQRLSTQGDGSRL